MHGRPVQYRSPVMLMLMLMRPPLLARARSYEPATRALPSAKQVAGSGDSSALFHPEISKNSSLLLTS
ncbi:uncharacterized protein RAG0_01220 [Rhynchosporium agropyri]|uniref:Secreted protein n=1 Tax=Rhynchosporium agropyri TaxID=914238 RepID=A0A1E1JW91_9HELO|nr:uncharacterized protein RAG0_01220 [Rhynchosporium agropyri]